MHKDKLSLYTSSLNNLKQEEIPDKFYKTWINDGYEYDVNLLKCANRILKDNQFSGTLDLSSGYRSSLQLIDLQNNLITNLVMGNQKLNFDLR